MYVAGQASSHCVLETLRQMTELFTSRDVVEKIHVLEDCTSPVPDVMDGKGNVIVPFAQMTSDPFDELKTKGVKFVKSTDPVDL